MSTNFEVAEPILNTPFDPPAEHWHIVEGHPPEHRPGRRAAGYWYRPPGVDDAEQAASGEWVELALVMLARERVGQWRAQGWPGATRTTLELLRYWTREGRHPRLFFAQLEAAETVIFLTEARADFRQGVDVPLDEPGEEKRAQGHRAFRRYACKMATGSGKTTVMALLIAWSILNKAASRGDARFSDTALVVCPNVTIRSRLGELDPEADEASLYRTRDIVPARLMPELRRGRVVVTNWHVFEPQGMQVGGVSAKVAKVGRRVVVRDTITIGARTTSGRGRRVLSREEYDRQVRADLLRVVEEHRDRQGSLVKVEIEAERWIESDTALVARFLGRSVGGKQNILVLNDEAHHAYRIRSSEGDDDGDVDDEAEDEDYLVKEATVWVDGLDKLHRLRSVNVCIDLSATPYFIARAGPDTNRVFPWTVSDFGLVDAIEAGLVKIPQLAVRDTTGAAIASYFNIWRWIMGRLTPSERGGKRASPKPEAILKHAHAPIGMLGGLWEEKRQEWAARPDEPRPPVLILVCKNVKIAKVVHEWLADDKAPDGVPPPGLPELRNRDGRTVTIRVDSKVVQETDSDGAKNDEQAWLRVTLDTVGRREWPRDPLGREVYPEAFAAVAEKLGRPLHPPGRDVRCIVSVGMLTEGWDCNTVTHIVGLRPFMSQLLCEQVVGRGLRRASYDVRADGRLAEEVATVLGVPFALVPFKANTAGAPPPRKPRMLVQAVPEKRAFELRFPRVEGYRRVVRHRVVVDWSAVAPIVLDPAQLPPNTEVKAFVPSVAGAMSVHGPGLAAILDLDAYRRQVRPQQRLFQAARDLVRRFRDEEDGAAPAHVLFPQMVRHVEEYVATRVRPGYGYDADDALLLSPFYGMALERLIAGIRPDEQAGETPELPVVESNRVDGSTAEVSFWSSRNLCEVGKSHINYVVADTGSWEQIAALHLDQHPAVSAFVKNAGLGFAVPYIHDGQPHDYEPDFIVKLVDGRHLVLEVKGHDPRAEVKAAAATRWCSAVNADGSWGQWLYAVTRAPSELPTLIADLV